MQSFLVFPIFIFLAGAVEYFPPPGKIDVLEGESLQMEIKDPSLDGKTRCQCLSKVYNCSFDLGFHIGSDLYCDPRISHYGWNDQCKIAVNSFKDEDPKEWILKADDKFTLNVEINLIKKAQILNQDISIFEGESLVQKLLVPDEEVTECYLTQGDQIIPLKGNSAKESPFEESDLLDRITPIEAGCGFKLTNVKLSDPTDWAITATLKSKTSYRGTFRIRVSSPNLEKKQIEVRLGTKATISCTSYNGFCTLINPSGVEVTRGTDCTHKIKTVGLRDIGEWTCSTDSTSAMRPEIKTIELLRVQGVSATTWFKQSDKFVTFGCQATRQETVRFCSMTSPTNKRFRITPGSATDRYTTLSTNLTEGICGMEIPKPLLDSEKGTWGCEVGSVGRVLSVEKPSEWNEGKKTKLVQKDEELTISCKIPFSSESCYIIDPKKSRYQNQNPYGAWMGECSTVIAKATLEHNGTWICLFAGDEDTPDYKVEIDVKIAELTKYREVKVSEGSNIELSCSADLPIEYCRFKAPDGSTYHLGTSRKGNSNKKLQYCGRGLDFGDCCLSLKKVRGQDQGSWTCMTRLGSDFDQENLISEILLRVYPRAFSERVSETGITAGISIAVLLLVSLTATFFYLQFRKRKQNRIDQQHGIDFAYPLPQKQIKI